MIERGDLIRALRCTKNENDDCQTCVYQVLCEGQYDYCDQERLELEAAEAIKSLREQLVRVTAERDAAIEYIPHDCETCRHWRPRTDNPCAAPDKTPCEYRKRQTWQWRGTQKEEG